MIWLIGFLVWCLIGFIVNCYYWLEAFEELTLDDCVMSFITSFIWPFCGLASLIKLKFGDWCGDVVLLRKKKGPKTS